MAQKTKRPAKVWIDANAVHPRLVAHRLISADIVTYIVMKLMEVPDGPTYTLKRRKGEPMFDLWMSARTFEAFYAILEQAHEDGEF